LSILLALPFGGCFAPDFFLAARFRDAWAVRRLLPLFRADFPAKLAAVRTVHSPFFRAAIVHGF